MDNRRLVLVFIFCFSLVMLWNSWQKSAHPPVAANPATQVAKDSGVPVPSAATNLPAGSAAKVSDVPAATADKGELVKVKTDLFTADISTMGGSIVGLELPKYRAAEDASKPFSLFEANHQYLAQSGLIGDGLPNHKTLFKVEGAHEIDASTAAVKVKLVAPVVDGVKVTKILTFTPGSYVINVAYEVENGGQKVLAPHSYYQLQRDTSKPAGEARMISTFTGPAVYTAEAKFQKLAFSDIEEGKAKFNSKADDGWVAMIQHYFVAAWIPAENAKREYYARKLDPSANSPIAAGVMVSEQQIAAGSKAAFSANLYAGPQIQSILDGLAKPVAENGIGAEGLPLVVDYGRLTIIAAPIFWCLDAIHKLVGNWGWAIVLLTIGIKAIFFPLSAASYKSMAKMRALAPRLQALKERCGDDRQKLNVEMMNLYKTEKVNPLGGCLPVLVQIPVFIALYWALLGAVEMRGAPWLGWITDLSAPDTLFGTIPFVNYPIGPLPIIMVITMLIQTKLNPTPPDPIQAKVTMAMPFIFGVMFFSFPSGLVLYWVVNNLLSITQQWYITRMVEAGSPSKRAAANDAKH